MYNPLLHGPQKVNILSSGFFIKYLSIAKLIKPIMTDKACDEISEEYVKLRFNQCVETGAALSHPVTVRTLETLIRISTAHAKARMYKHIEDQDVRAAIELVRLSYNFQEILETSKRKWDQIEDEWTTADTVTLDPDRYMMLISKMASSFQTVGVTTLPIKRIMELMMKKEDGDIEEEFSEEEVRTAIKKMRSAKIVTIKDENISI